MKVYCNNLTWDQAQNHCEGLGFNLARIMNRERNTGRVENCLLKDLPIRNCHMSTQEREISAKLNHIKSEVFVLLKNLNVHHKIDKM